MEATMRVVLAPALEQFKRLVASKRARGATDQDISKMLDEIELSMREIGIMSDAKISESMRIYHEALREEAIREDARKQADAILGTLLDTDPRRYGGGTKKGYIRGRNSAEDR